ncbi:hybrid sensor histidine kinase/response regulator [Roseimicrobium sp. ORNL1]|uniref:hybrid sensor histidine kinase/response regulator n=1 Tax=Roseimicrobium sp. ORNL1 TaxID=2711231 RepID=UPI0013E1337F|nr:hybrid sensor histidine kinase/response regulator [Roseimicrobium sp. ORNL1]QIF04008.1 response regulator [Roseimicrobium sp. ORNL1]
MDGLPPIRKLLILDDNGIDRETCRRYLTKAPGSNYEFVEHNSVEGAMDIVLSERPDCILLDYHLHDGNGVEFLQELVSVGGPRSFPVVMLTGTGNEAIAVQVMKAGAQDYLVKDRLNPDLLHRAVENAMYKAHTERLLEQQRREMEQLFLETQEANARKDQFLAALSHELRTPLTPVLAAVTATDVENSDPEQLRNMLAVIRRNVELEARLIDDLLDLTRISRGKLEVDLRPTDLHSLLHHAVETCQEDIAHKQLTLVWQLDASLCTVQADPARMQQVFWNLLKNAVKFTPAGGRIVISTRNEPGERIIAEVKDTGVGIDPSFIGRIFDAFEQGSPEITRHFGGLGLGLAIAKALVDAHSGTIQAESDPTTGGAAFAVTLRCTKQAPAVSVSTPASGPANDVDGHASIHLLLVEDHIDTAKVLGRIISREGYQVHLAGSIGEAVRLCEKQPMDCVISDIGLPDGSGTELLAKLNQIRPTRGIALSGYGTERDVERSRKAGFSEHLTKPVHWPKLERALKELLNGPK